MSIKLITGFRVVYKYPQDTVKFSHNIYYNVLRLKFRGKEYDFWFFHLWKQRQRGHK